MTTVSMNVEQGQSEVTVNIEAPGLNGATLAEAVNAGVMAALKTLDALDRVPDPLGPTPYAAATRLAAGLRVIARGCEKSTSSGEWDCWTNKRTADARYGADRACDPCIAARVLAGDPLPTEADTDAEPSPSPHEFFGRTDRWCEQCNRPDRDPIHHNGRVQP